MILSFLFGFAAAFPEKFKSDSGGKKENLRAQLLQKLKLLLKQKAAGELPKSRLRFHEYGRQAPKFTSDISLHVVEAVSSEGAFRPHDSFKNLRRSTTEAAAAMNDARPVEGELCHACTNSRIIEISTFNVGTRESVIGTERIGAVEANSVSPIHEPHLLTRWRQINWVVPRSEVNLVLSTYFSCPMLSQTYRIKI